MALETYAHFYSVQADLNELYLLDGRYRAHSTECARPESLAFGCPDEVAHPSEHRLDDGMRPTALARFTDRRIIADLIADDRHGQIMQR